MKVQGRTAGVTDVGVDNLGRYFAQELLLRGAAKVYATARRPEPIDVCGVEVLCLHPTDSATIARAASSTAECVSVKRAAYKGGKATLFPAAVVVKPPAARTRQ